MKKILALILAAVLCLGMLAACGGNGGEDQTPESTGESQEEQGAVAPETNLKFGLICYNLTDAVPVHIKNMMEAYADMLNVELEVVAKNGAEGNMEAVEGFIQNGVDCVLSASVEGIDAWFPKLEEAGIYLCIGATKVLSDVAKEAVEGSEYFLGQVNFNDAEVMYTMVQAAYDDGATSEIGLIAPTNVTPNYLGIRKQAGLDKCAELGITPLEGTGESYFDFAGFTTSLLATYPDLGTFVSVTTPDSAYAAITQAEMNGKVKLYGINRADNAVAAFEDGTLQAYCAGTEHCAAQFLIAYNFFMGRDLRENGQYIDLESAPLYVWNIEDQAKFDEGYGDKVLYDVNFMLQCDTLAELQRMVEKATLDNIVNGTYLDGVLD